MSKRVTIAEVATLAGVDKATVSRALNTRTQHQVNADTARDVHRAAKQLGYVPNAMARGLRTRLSMTIGVIVPDVTNPIFPPVIRGIERYLSPRGYTALLANTDGRITMERAAFDSLLNRQVDGVILATGQLNHSWLSGPFDREVRAVLVNRGSADSPYPLVTGDDASGIVAAVDHLVQLGHRHILHIAGPANFTTTVTRSQAFSAAATRHPMVEHGVIEASALNVASGEAIMNDVLHAGRPRPSAVVAGNDLLALGVMRSLKSHGLSCPTDLSVVGFNDIPFAEDFSPPLTTVRAPHLDMGTQAARLLLEAITTRAQSPLTLMLPVSLIVRGSTAPPPAHALSE